MTTRAQPFITTFWCGPPLDQFNDVRAAEIARAGFTVVGPPCEGAMDAARNRRALDVAARHGLTMWVRDPRYDESTLKRPNWEAQLNEATADYKDHPAFDGYFVTDEPSPELFADLGEVTARLHASTDRPAYINLFADYVPTGFKTPTYREYVERFIAATRPRLLSYDYYPFGPGIDRPTFFTNLALIRELAGQHRLPFMLIVLAMPHGGYRDPSEAELRWQIFHALAYGARGVSYFAYWTPVDVEFQADLKFRKGLIEHGRPTEHYRQAARINPTVRAYGHELEAFRSIGVADSRGDVAPKLPLGPITSIEGGSITVGMFEDDANRRAAVLVNRNYRAGATITVRSSAGAGRLERFDVKRGRWVDGGKARFKLAAGDAVLIRWVK